MKYLTMVNGQSQVSTKSSDLILKRNSRIYTCTIDDWKQIEFNEFKDKEGNYSQSIDHKQLLNLLSLDLSNGMGEQYLEWR